MKSNISKYKKDLDRLIDKGELLHIAMQYECFPVEVEKKLGKNSEEIIKSLPNFKEEYQTWYSEVKALVKQLLPDRLADLVRHYEKPKPRKDITYENYRIEDYFQDLNVTRGYEKQKIVGPDAAIPHYRQQQAILKATSARFESSLFDIRQLVQADLLDTEISSSEELLKNGFVRASGAIAGVILEKHLNQVCENHNISFRKKSLTISDFYNELKSEGVIDVPDWRFIQHLGDIRNLCDHNKKLEPTKEQVQDLISGVKKITKTIY